MPNNCFKMPIERRYDIQHNDTEHNGLNNDNTYNDIFNIMLSRVK
jgi:hypothetical protein